MDKNKEIEEMAFIALKNTLSYTCAKQIAINFYNAGYRKTFTSDLASDTQKAYKDGYIKGIEEAEAEIEILKIQNKNLGIAFDRLEAQNERLTERLKQVLLSIDTVKEMNAMCNIDEQKKQAVKEFAEKVKGKLQDFGDGGEKGAYITEKDINKLLK